MADYMKAEERLFAMFPGIDLQLASLAPTLSAQLPPSPTPGLGGPLSRLSGRVAAAITALTHSIVRFGAGGCAAAKEQREADAAVLAAKLRELREKLPTAEDRQTLLTEYSSWLDGLREQLVIQHGEAQARLVVLRNELEEVVDRMEHGREAVAAMQEQRGALERARWRALQKYDEAQVSNVLYLLGGGNHLVDCCLLKAM